MSHNSRELDKLQRGCTKLVGPAKARALRKDLEKKIVLAAKQGGGGKPAKTESPGHQGLDQAEAGRMGQGRGRGERGVGPSQDRLPFSRLQRQGDYDH